MFSLIVDRLLTLTSCSAVTVVDVAELDSPDVDGDTVFTGPKSEDIFKTQKRIYRWGQMVRIFNCLLMPLFFNSYCSCSGKVHLSSAHDNTPWG